MNGGMVPISRLSRSVRKFGFHGESQVNDTGAPTDIADGKLARPPADDIRALSARNASSASDTSSADEALVQCSDRVRRAKPVRVPAECGDLPFLIKRDGTWLYRGTPINRKELVCLFSSVLRREADGSWWLQTPAERGRIEVEDAPFVAVELDWTGDGRHQVLSFRTNIDEVVTAGPDHPIRVSHDLFTCEPTPYILVRQGAAPHLAVEARINRATYYELVALAVPEWVGNKRLLGVWSRGKFFSLGELPPSES
jgi:uncharacterized protein